MAIQNALEWIEHNEFFEQYWYAGVILAVLIVVVWLIIRWIRNWVI